MKPTYRGLLLSEFEARQGQGVKMLAHWSQRCEGGSKRVSVRLMAAVGKGQIAGYIDEFLPTEANAVRGAVSRG